MLHASADHRRGDDVLVDLPHLGLDLAGDESRSDAAGPAEHVAETSLSEAVEEYKRRLVRAAVRRHGGNWAAAARSLGMHRSNLHHLARRLGLRTHQG